ncbi:MAG: glycosyltransferase family 4 protein [Candidatus Latescibacterota bacterium]|nr:MAG: glycosyltransferase family 4 protein [Candidatus Latescibacterota bacterium]
MRVLQINKFFFEKGGSERYFFSVSRSLEKRGHSVIHFSMRHPSNLESPYSEFFVDEKNYTAAHSGMESVRLGASFIHSKEAAVRLTELIRVARPDIAHLHNIYHQITPSIIPVLDNGGIPVVMTLHDHKLVCPNYGFFDGRTYCDRCRGGRFYQAALTRCSNRSFVRGVLLAAEAYWQRWSRVYDRVRRFVCPSRYLRDQHRSEGFGGDRVVYLPPYILDEGNNGGEDDAPGVVDSLPSAFVLYFGRLGSEKGLVTLIDAMARCDSVPLVVCGDGPLRCTLQTEADRRLTGRVTFTGHLPKSDLDRVVERARMVVTPSECPENAPFAVLESMSRGVPVVVSDMGGLPELAEMGGCVTFPAGDVESLADRIATLWSNPDRARSIGRDGKRVVTKNLTEAKHLDGLETIYGQAVGLSHTREGR